MIDTLSAVTRERLRRFVRIVRMAAVIGAGVGAIYGGAIPGPDARALLGSLLISIPIGVIAALLTASWIAGIEIFLLPRAGDPRSRMPLHRIGRSARPLDPPPDIRTRDLGALAMRGRVEPIRAFCVEHG